METGLSRARKAANLVCDFLTENKNWYSFEEIVEKIKEQNSDVLVGEIKAAIWRLIDGGVVYLSSYGLVKIK